MVVLGFDVFSTVVTLLLLAPSAISCPSRTSPPSGAAIVRPSGAASGEFTSVQAAVDSLPNDSSSQVIFIFPGLFEEQVTISRHGPLTIYGSTTDTTSFTQNSVTISHSASKGTAGSDSASATLIVNKANFQLYNVNVKNTFGRSSINGQALAVSADGNNQGYYGVGLYSYQDTLYCVSGVQFYGSCYIEGAVDFIFGRHGHAFFQNNTIASIGPGTITADGPDNSTDGIFVINESQIILASNAASDTNENVFYGRPWSHTARVVFSNSNIGSHINPAGWTEWSAATPNTDEVFFAEFNNTGAGASGQRAPFAKKLTSDAGYTISDILGSNYASWVDSDYLV